MSQPKYDTRNNAVNELCQIMDVGQSCPHRNIGLIRCGECGREFRPVGPQRFCDHACYSASLRVGIEDRFWSKVNKDGPIPLHCPELGPCWLWTAGTIRGYGQISATVNGKKRPVYAHRVSWEFANGPIPDGLNALHRCDVPLCVRPAHLFLGTQQQNLDDARQKGRLDESLPRDGVLTLADRLAIYAVRQYRGVCVELARQYGVTKTAIHHIRKGRFAGCPQRQPRPLSVHPRASLNNVQRVAFVHVPVRGVLHVENSTEPNSAAHFNSLEVSQ